MTQMGGLYEIIITIVTTAVTAALVAVWNFFARKTKTLKNLTIDLRTSCEIRNAMQDLIRKAEEFMNWSGAEKKAWVMNQLRLLALDKKVIFDEEILSNEIDDAVAFSNSVNTVDTKKKTVITGKQEKTLRDEIIKQQAEKPLVVAVPAGKEEATEIKDPFRDDDSKRDELQAEDRRVEDDDEIEESDRDSDADSGAAASAPDRTNIVKRRGERYV